MPARYYESTVKFLLEKCLAGEVDDVQAYRHAASEIERMSADPQLDPIMQAVLQKAVQKLREIADQEAVHQQEVYHVLRSLGIVRASSKPLVGEPIKSNP